jgi:hypothetical protein
MPEDNPEPNPRRALIGLIALVAAIAVVVFVMDELHRSARLQDCFASGRTNCVPIETHLP